MPARNEAEVIDACVRALAAEQPTSIVVIDDRSTDETPAILRRLAGELPLLEIKEGQGPGPGECGKPAALANAVGAGPADEWLLFVDADVILSPGALGALLGLAESTGADLVSILPRLEMHTFAEKLFLPAIGAFVLGRYPPAKVADPAKREAFANGQLILVRRGVYERAGGHRAVIKEILEDVRLADKVKAAGGRLCIADGRGLARTRMYQSWSELAEGWSKNLFLLLGESVPRALLAAFFAAFAGLSGLVAIGLSPRIGLFVYALSLVIQGSIRRAVGSSPFFALLAPLGGIVTAKLVIDSLVKFKVKRRVEWKGRSYPG